jgi:rhamnosyltransferase
MEKVFGVVILYNPSDDIKQNILCYLHKVEKLFIFDNSERVVDRKLEELGDKVIVIADGVNRGISARLNAAARAAITEGGKWLLTMDQDSFFSETVLEQYWDCINKFDYKDEISMFGVEYEKANDHPGCEWEVTTQLITSGSMVNLLLYPAIGGFDEQLFIDEVDAEYCFKSNQKGYRTVKLKNIFLNHSLGVVSTHRSLKSFKKTPRTLHSPLRVYYMIRNYLYISHAYQQEQPESFSYRKKALMNRIKNNLLYGKDRMLLVKYLWLACWHFKTGKMGKFKK